MADRQLEPVGIVGTDAADPVATGDEQKGVLDRVLDLVDADAATRGERSFASLGEGLTAARVVEVRPNEIRMVSWDEGVSFVAQLAPFVDAKLLEEGHQQGRVALVDSRRTGVTLIGFLQTTAGASSKLQGRNVEIEATHELVLRSGRAALRLGADGTVELVGTRISAVSRGVLRLLGRALRLN